ncbi:MAG: spore maturation protein [Oscillibacter sp.]|nr:spore maturation protein [Oscillibacter sp.]
MSLLLPLLLSGVGLCGLWRRADVYASLTRGAEEGFRVLYRILPALVTLLPAIAMLRASGAMEAFSRWCAPLWAACGIPPEVAPLILVRPVSGSGAFAAAGELIRAYGPDSLIGRTAAVMLGSTETTFYTVAVYFGAAGVRRTRHAIPAALVADITGFAVAALSVRLFFPD